jgi:hypothetical protein
MLICEDGGLKREGIKRVCCKIICTYDSNIRY